MANNKHKRVSARSWVEAHYVPTVLGTEATLDAHFDGSVWQKVGLDKWLCPFCKAHLYGGRCLNLCGIDFKGMVRT